MEAYRGKLAKKRVAFAAFAAHSAARSSANTVEADGRHTIDATRLPHVPQAAHAEAKVSSLRTEAKRWLVATAFT